MHTLIWTGLRRSEVLGLSWQDVELYAATLSITSVINQLGDSVIVVKKTVNLLIAQSLMPSFQLPS